MGQSITMPLMGSTILPYCLMLAALCFGCASAQPLRSNPGYSPVIAEKAAATAESMIGRPYQYRGDTPSGFDCSGLVRYSYLAAGMDLPHGTTALRERSRPIKTGQMRRGDLVFFTQLGKKYSHVGIFLGNDRFVHAPSSGKTVRADDLNSNYWRKHFLGARRL